MSKDWSIGDLSHSNSITEHLQAEIKVLRTELEESLKGRDDMSSGFEALRIKVEIAAKCKKGLDKNGKLKERPVGLTPEAAMLRRAILAKKNVCIHVTYYFRKSNVLSRYCLISWRIEMHRLEARERISCRLIS